VTGTTPSGNTAFDVSAPTGDPYFDPSNTGTAVIYFSHSIYDAATGTAVPNVQEQVYTITCRPTRFDR
jgi:peroxidase